jgi:diguanylate cyclase (GGDEF)-like protein
MNITADRETNWHAFQIVQHDGRVDGEKEDEALETMAATDGLIGLYNFRYFKGELKGREEQGRFGRPVSLLMADVDWFKHYNDTNGRRRPVPQKGGRGLHEERKRLTASARYGGEEFAVILPETLSRGAAGRAPEGEARGGDNPIRGASARRRCHDQPGGGPYPGDGTDAQSLLEAADRAHMARRGIPVCRRWWKGRG